MIPAIIIAPIITIVLDTGSLIRIIDFPTPIIFNSTRTPTATMIPTIEIFLNSILPFLVLSPTNERDYEIFHTYNQHIDPIYTSNKF